MIILCHRERIICPDCGSVESATVEHTLPWYSYVHTCHACGYIIMESEWQRADKNYSTVARLRKITKGKGNGSFPAESIFQKISNAQRHYLLTKGRVSAHHF